MDQDITSWVNQNDEHRDLRRAMHTVIVAMATMTDLEHQALMKGGVLLGLVYGSPRYTSDIDFSTDARAEEFDDDAFKKALDTALRQASVALDYDLECRVQAFKRQPPKPGSSYVTLRINAGYAYRTATRSMTRLRKGQSSDVVAIDYSLNEPLGEAEIIDIDGTHQIKAYPLHDILAEKYRAILQQPVRYGGGGRRPQDPYDIYFLLTNNPRSEQAETQRAVKQSLVEKARARDLEVGRDSIADPEVRRRSQDQYTSNLTPQVPGELPAFDDVFETVKAYYESLPWMD